MLSAATMQQLKQTVGALIAASTVLSLRCIRHVIKEKLQVG
jgi:hypothetical protein